jgi:two-component system chemotaxis response regulator CheY
MNLQEISVLVVDDFSTMRRIIRGLLKDCNIVNVEEAEDGAIALSICKKASFDLVISDINMPNMNGFELLKAIKAHPSLEHIPVLMVTAEARKDDILMAAKSGAAGYIVKPFSKSVLEDKVLKVLNAYATKRLTAL